MNKARSYRVHTKRRAHERYGIGLTRRDLQWMVQCIQGGQAEFLERQSNRISVWRVTVGITEMRAVYDKSRKAIVTVLPLLALSDEAPQKS